MQTAYSSHVFLSAIFFLFVLHLNNAGTKINVYLSYNIVEIKGKAQNEHYFIPFFINFKPIVIQNKLITEGKHRESQNLYLERAMRVRLKFIFNKKEMLLDKNQSEFQLLTEANSVTRRINQSSCEKSRSADHPLCHQTRKHPGPIRKTVNLGEKRTHKTIRPQQPPYPLHHFYLLETIMVYYSICNVLSSVLE